MRIGFLLRFARLARLDSSLIAASTIFIPLWFLGLDTSKCARFALPIFTASMGGFTLNDIIDAERDALNHPTRPIPSKRVSERQAMVLYFTLLFATLTLVRLWIPVKEIFYYLVFVVALANYGFVVERFPYLKNPYVGAATIIPVLIVISVSDNERIYPWLPVAVFFFITGREIILDLRDQIGDGRTLVKIIGDKRGVTLAFTIQLLGLILLVPIAVSEIERVAVAIMLGMHFILYILWRSRMLLGLIPQAMKIQILLGLVFLVTSREHL